MYLFHFPVSRLINLTWLDFVFEQELPSVLVHPYLILSAKFVLTFVVAAVSWRFIESPILSLRRHVAT